MVLGRNKLSIVAAIIALVTSAASVRADTLLFESKGKGDEIKITLDPTMAGKTIAIYAAAPKNTYQTVDIAVRGVGGELVTAEAFTMTGKQSPELAMNDTTNALSLFGYGSSKGVPKFKISKLPGSAGSSSFAWNSATGNAPDPTCACMTPSQIESAVEDYRKAFPNATRDDFCKLVPAVPGGICPDVGTPGDPGGGGGEPPSAGVIYATAFVPFNSCLKASRPGVILKIDLTEVDSASLEGGEIVASLKLRAFDGRSRAVLKESDGGKFPGWISLTAPVGGGWGASTDLIEMVNWKAKRMAKVRRLKVGDIVNYDGPLSRTPLGGNLNGGKGTFHVSYRGEGYSFCAKFIKVRQQFNGYKKFG